MNNPYSPEQKKWLNDLQEHYRSVTNGICMATIRLGGESSTEPCEGPIGHRHAIAKRHLKLIAECNAQIRANRETGTFAKWREQYDDLELVPISRFSAGRWSCQRHDERFGGIDAQQIDLSEPENLFKAIYRVVLRQNHLMLARWNAFFGMTQTAEGWNLFKETAFERTLSDEEASKAEAAWRDETHAVMRKMRDLERRLRLQDWNSLEFRALLVASKPTVAGWGCLMMKFDLSGLRADDPRRHWDHHIELGYVVVIPQQEGHAIITGCEPETPFRVPEIVKIHRFMPVRTNPKEPHTAEALLKRGLSQRIWELNEIGMCELLYQSWSDAERNEVKAWMKKRGSRQPTLLKQALNSLPSFL